MWFHRWLSFFCLIGALQAGPYDPIAGFPTDRPLEDPVGEEFGAGIQQRLRVIDLQVNELRNQFPLILEEMMRFITTIMRTLDAVHTEEEDF